MPEPKREYPPLLPAGFVRISMDGLQDVCCLAFAEDVRARRVSLLAGLARFVAELRSYGIAGELWVDGSFLTEKPEPGDIDTLLVAEFAQLDGLAAGVQQRIFELFRSGAALAEYGCDAYVIDAGDAPQRSYWRGWFGYTRKEQPKGVAVLTV